MGKTKPLFDLFSIIYLDCKGCATLHYTAGFHSKQTQRNLHSPFWLHLTCCLNALGPLYKRTHLQNTCATDRCVKVRQFSTS